MSEKMDIIQILLHGGPVVKGVLLLLALSSIYSWAIIFRKKRQLKLVEANNNTFMDTFGNAQSFDEIVFKTENLTFCPYKEMMASVSLEIEKMIGCRPSEENMVKNIHLLREIGDRPLERAIGQGMNKSNLFLDQGLSQLASIGSVAPFIGLFGTVWGIINSFTGLGQGGGSIDAVAPGIAEALVATAVGLAAAIPAVYAYNHFSNKNSRLNVLMESFQQEILNRVKRLELSR
ncbi:MAG: MotA/TolQ/ExbB proton channel family protein [Halobacteriovoraceae bacterium]|nr:MotA/TolQ/ExbB proton channel family protein [Halobacteriovoraceae bacterium]